MKCGVPSFQHTNVQSEAGLSASSEVLKMISAAEDFSSQKHLRSF